MQLNFDMSFGGANIQTIADIFLYAISEDSQGF
jgi:hypothetical protein